MVRLGISRIGVSEAGVGGLCPWVTLRNGWERRNSPLPSKPTGWTSRVKPLVILISCVLLGVWTVYDGPATRTLPHPSTKPGVGEQRVTPADDVRPLALRGPDLP